MPADTDSPKKPRPHGRSEICVSRSLPAVC